MSKAALKPFSTSAVRQAIDLKREAELAKEKLVAIPEQVSIESSVRHTTSEIGVEQPEPDVDMMAGIKGDFVRKDMLAWKISD